MRKQLIIPAAAIAIIAAGAIVTSTVSAHGFGHSGDLASNLADRFGLDENELNEFMEQMHTERHQARTEIFVEQLSDSVKDGTISQNQMDEILEHHEGMQQIRESLKDSSPEERREAMRSHHEEMMTWAEEHDVDLQSLMMPLHQDGRRGHRSGN